MKKKYPDTILIFLYFFLFVYVALRAFYLSFTFDESLSFQIINGDEVVIRTANHHALNTWLMQLCSFCFGNSEFSLRLPNVLSFIVYLFFTHKLLTLIRLPLKFFISLPLILFNPFILDFFSLARGYGLSLAFMMGSLHYFLMFTLSIKEKAMLKHFVFALTYASLALAANLSLINFYVAVLSFCILKYFFNKDFQSIRPLYFTIACAVALVPLYFGIARLLFLKKGNELYYGTGDLYDTVKTLIERSFYFSTYPFWLADGIKYFALYFCAAGILFLLFRRNRSGPYFWTVALFTLIIFGLFIEHRFFEALYPVGRTGIYLIPLFAIFISLFFNNLTSFMKGPLKKIFTTILCVVFSVPILFHFSRKINFYYCYEWRHDSNTKHVAQILNKKEFKNKLHPLIAVTWIFEPTMNYYNITRKMGLKIIPWYGDGPIEAIYTVNHNNPGAGWKEVENYQQTNSGLFFKDKQPSL